MNNEDGFKSHSLEAEAFVIGALLIDNTAIDRISELDHSHFYTDANRVLYRAIRNQAALGKSWDVFTIFEFVESHGQADRVGGMKYIGEVARDTPTSANIQHYAQIVRDYAVRRQIMATSVALADMLASKTPIDEILNKSQSDLLAIGATADSDEPRSMSEIISGHMDIMAQRIDSDKTNVISTGLIDLDKFLVGGFRGGNLIVLAARPSMGKTALAMHMAIHAAKNKNSVLFLSMEMVASELMDRVIAADAQIGLAGLILGELKENEWDSLAAATAKLKNTPLYVLDKSGLSFYRVASVARKFKRTRGLKMLVVDYLQLMQGDDDENRNAQIQKITMGLKILAKDLDIPIILLSQLNRKATESRRPQMSHLRDSGAIEQDADVVLFVHREEVDNPDTPHTNYADIYVAKNRQGKLGRIGANYQGEFVRFTNYAGSLPDFEDAKKSDKKAWGGNDKVL